MGVKILEPLVQAHRLIANARRDGDCLLPALVPNAKGYCYITRGRGVRLRAHRFIYETLVGEIPEGMLVRHTCDNRVCINPDHLIIGTAADNSQDMVSRNRQARNFGGKALAQDAYIQCVSLRNEGFTLAEIATIQGLAGPSGVEHRLRRAKELGYV